MVLGVPVFKHFRVFRQGVSENNEDSDLTAQFSNNFMKNHRVQHFRIENLKGVGNVCVCVCVCVHVHACMCVCVCFRTGERGGSWAQLKLCIWQMSSFRVEYKRYFKS